ncbi:MAG: VOC family protein [Myxococcota bacterium]
MLHHVSLAVANLEASGALYDAALAPLGYGRVWTVEDAIGYGRPGGGDKFALKFRGPHVAKPSPGFHLAFAAVTTTSIDSFYQAALAHGGIDNGPPGPRPRYGPHYYAAFIIDLDGYPIEAVKNDG